MGISVECRVFLSNVLLVTKGVGHLSFCQEHCGLKINKQSTWRKTEEGFERQDEYELSLVTQVLTT